MEEDRVVKSNKTLVLCFDGTAAEYDGDNTNIPLFFSFLKKNNNREQLCYYQPGVGTYFNPGVVSPVFTWAAKILDEAFAWYLDEHVMDGYRFIMSNYEAGDKICLFGFSRGAYTARALAGFLYKVGLLSKDNDAQVPFAYKLYEREDKDGLELCRGYKKTYCQEVDIEFVGVWDTVASVGIFRGRTLPFVSSNHSIKTFRHAVSLDERRAKYLPNLYHRPTPKSEAKAAILKGASTSSSTEHKTSLWCFPGSKNKKDQPIEFGEASDVLEVWFAGYHSDVGGGKELNGTLNSLNYISLRWMIREVIKSGCGIKFDNEALKQLKIEFDDEKIKEVDRVDALAQEHDSLVLDRIWWLLEIIPMKFRYQEHDGSWKTTFRWHLGRGRRIVNKEPVFHSSVKTRVELKAGYKPRAEWEAGTERYVS
ncbi:hypothetical protein Agabi119p4_7526 [Agaricus bisporus var. burnettii]|uniref:T6SS Phospholipase effector Tle1-like catalytic domain-containing protein n=1 Tax=Agaricus bisporus var. burnettii TaxID=192524 RepID=A0A8H7C886_AGABI|nr:hypothetical protein Agabi119p4_7526 [Agaricus bisporus var. burnettii]